MPADIAISLKLLLLLGVANATPIAVKRLLGPRWSFPLDFGATFVDGAPVLGASKTVRGLIAAVSASALCAMMLGIPGGVGAAIGFFAMIGDALSSFVKRRLHVAPGGKATGLDQIPEALLPLLAVWRALDLSFGVIVAVTVLFFVLEMPLARLSHRLGLRDTPY